MNHAIRLQGVQQAKQAHGQVLANKSIRREYLIYVNEKV